MDSGNGRSGRVEGKPLVFTLPYSLEEILLLTDGTGQGMGIIYNPRQIAPPIPWRANCLHCLRGQQADLDITLKRAIKVIASRKILKDDVEEYTVPTNGHPCQILCKRSGKELAVKIIQPNEEPIEAIWQDTKFIAQNKSLMLESKIIVRTLKLLNSVHKTSRREARACLKPLLDQQRNKGISIHRRFLCLKIDWAALLAP